MSSNNYIDTKIDKFKIKFATKKDVPFIVEQIKKLANYEKMSNKVVLTNEILLDSLFNKKSAEALIGEYDSKSISYAVFFHNFSTFTGKRGMYLEDIYVDVEYRRRGIGKIMLSFLAKLAKERDCSRFEWACLDWNEPSKKFYKELGAVPMEDWTIFRIDGDRLEKLSNSFD